MKFSRPLIAILVVSVFNFIVGALTCGGFFSWVYKVEPTIVWKPMGSYLLPWIILEILVTNILFVVVYELIKKGVPGANKYVKGLVYGLLVWLVGMVPGMIATATYMIVSQVVIIYWTILSLIINPIKGVITSSICGDE